MESRKQGAIMGKQSDTMYYAVARSVAEAYARGRRFPSNIKIHAVFASDVRAQAYIEKNRLGIACRVVAM